MTYPASAMLTSMHGLPRSSREELLALLEERERRKRLRRELTEYAPYPKQAEFHAAGLKHRERLFMAGNQLGKTKAGAAEWAMHLTGRYPDWWQGRRFDHPVALWASGVTSISTRDNPQRLLIGPPAYKESWGTGAIPGTDILGYTRGGLPDALDSVTVQHQSGGVSFLAFKSYEQGREKWQGPTLHGVWFDEEPPLAIYSEGLTRTNATGGIVMLTFTPLLGMSEVVRLFLSDEKAEAGVGRSVTRMTIDDALHYTPEQRAAIVAAYPAHEREARAKGIPTLGSGRIFPVPEDAIKVPAFALPPHWPRIGALDFGWEHPTAAVELAWDRDGDCVYVTRCYRVREATPVVHGAALRAWGEWLPWAWPHDGNNDTAAGENLATQYRAQKLRMLPERAQFEDGSNSVEAGLMLLLDRMLTGRLKVFDHLADWFEEFLLYHRKDGKVVKEHDDLMSATRYGAMMLRFAKLPTVQRRAPLQISGGFDPADYGIERRHVGAFDE